MDSGETEGESVVAEKVYGKERGGGCVVKIFKSPMGALGKIIVTQPKST